MLQLENAAIICDTKAMQKKANNLNHQIDKNSINSQHYKRSLPKFITISSHNFHDNACPSS